MIPESKWKWYGTALHFICGHRCRFHQGTLVGQYIISTVGDFYDHGGKRQTVGSERWGETYVFKFGHFRDCDCPQFEGCEIDATCYGEDATCKEMNAGHLAMCRKYAEMQEDATNG